MSLSGVTRMLKKIFEELLIAVGVAIILAAGGVICLTGYKLISDPLVKSPEEVQELRSKAKAESGELGEDISNAVQSVQNEDNTDYSAALQAEAIVENAQNTQDQQQENVQPSDGSQGEEAAVISDTGSSDGAQGESVAAGSVVSVYGLKFKLPDTYTWRFNLGGNGYYFRPDENTYSPILAFHSVSSGDKEINDSTAQEIMQKRIEMLKSQLDEGWEIDQDESAVYNGFSGWKFVSHGNENGKDQKSAVILLYNPTDQAISEIDLSCDTGDFDSRMNEINDMLNS